MKKSIWLLPLTIAMLAGCVNIDYVGQKLPPKGDESVILVYDSPDLVPPDVYRPLGRITLTAPDGYTVVNIKEKLEAKARETGGDAIEIVSMQKRKIGTAFRENDFTIGNPTLSSYNSNVSRSGSPIYTDTFGQSSTRSAARSDRFEIEVKAMVLARKESVVGLKTESDNDKTPANTQ